MLDVSLFCVFDFFVINGLFFLLNSGKLVFAMPDSPGNYRVILFGQALEGLAFFVLPD
jgi:hypothetical protein